MSAYVGACRCSLVLAALSTWPTPASADGRPDTSAAIAAAAWSGQPAELARAAQRTGPEVLARCIREGPRTTRIACVEASRYVRVDPMVVAALAATIPARDRAIAIAAVAVLAELVSTSGGADPSLDAPALARALVAQVVDPRIAPDVRAGVLRALTRLRASGIDVTAAARDPDPLVRREAVPLLAARDLEAIATRDQDDSVAAAAAAALCEMGRVSAAVDTRVERWLSGSSLGPASVAPLLACARGRPAGRPARWLDLARRGPRADVRALVQGSP